MMKLPLFYAVGSLVLIAFFSRTPAAVQNQEPVPVGGNVRKPARTHFVPPTYPPGAEAQGIESLVILEMTVGPGGEVVSVRPLRGAESTISAAVDAARQWRYEPTLVDGEPVAVRFSETVLFVLRKPAPPPPGRTGGNSMFLRPAAPGTSSASFEPWELEGESMTACPCDTPCPCRSNAPPSHPPCHATTVQHFDSGHYGSVDLSGVTYVSLGPETWTALYFDERMTDEQRRAILDIYASMVPGAQQVYRAVESVPIRYQVNEDHTRKTVEIPGILSLTSRRRTGANELFAFGMDVWSNRLFYGDTGVYRYQDDALGEAWDHSGRQSNHKSFHVSKADYDERRMLIQHGDGSGYFTLAQERIIACLR
jgi:TonB family protein